MCDQLRQKRLLIVLLHPFVQALGISALLIDDCEGAMTGVAEAT
jgi:hypothetical protein